MPTILEAAIAEAYASAPRDRVIFHTVELNHAAFPQPQRFVTGRETDLVATLEATAPVGGGQPATFQAMAFNFVAPGVGENGPTPARITIDNVSGHLVPILDLTIGDNSPIHVIYRAFRDDVLSGPGDVIRGLLLRNVRLTALSASGDLYFKEVDTQAFPLGVYDKERFPALFA